MSLAILQDVLDERARISPTKGGYCITSPRGEIWVERETHQCISGFNLSIKLYGQPLAYKRIFVSATHPLYSSICKLDTLRHSKDAQEIFAHIKIEAGR